MTNKLDLYFDKIYRCYKGTGDETLAIFVETRPRRDVGTWYILRPSRLRPQPGNRQHHYVSLNFLTTC